MELEEHEFKTLKQIPVEHRNTLVELIKMVKIDQCEKINKNIVNNDIIKFRHGVITLANVLISAMKTEKYDKQNATLLTREKVQDRKKVRTTAQMRTKLKTKRSK